MTDIESKRHIVVSSAAGNPKPYRDYRGPFRPIRAGEIVEEVHVTTTSGERLVPEGIYGGRRKRGPLPVGVRTDRRQS